MYTERDIDELLNQRFKRQPAATTVEKKKEVKEQGGKKREVKQGRYEKKRKESGTRLKWNENMGVVNRS